MSRNYRWTKVDGRTWQTEEQIQDSPDFHIYRVTEPEDPSGSDFYLKPRTTRESTGPFLSLQSAKDYAETYYDPTPKRGTP